MDALYLVTLEHETGPDGRRSISESEVKIPEWMLDLSLASMCGELMGAGYKTALFPDRVGLGRGFRACRPLFRGSDRVRCLDVFVRASSCLPALPTLEWDRMIKAFSAAEEEGTYGAD